MTSGSPAANPAGNTARLHRVVRAPADRVYRAFLDPDAMVKWLPPHGFTGQVHQMDARVGGGYRMSFTNFGTGKSHSLPRVAVAVRCRPSTNYAPGFVIRRGSSTSRSFASSNTFLSSATCRTVLPVADASFAIAAAAS